MIAVVCCQIAVLTSEYETRLATTVERYESKICSLKEEHKSTLVNTTADQDTKYAICVEKYEVAAPLPRSVKHTHTHAPCSPSPACLLSP
jgi:hypothetical protein